jgi:hypothetical protein
LDWRHAAYLSPECVPDSLVQVEDPSVARDLNHPSTGSVVDGRHRRDRLACQFRRDSPAQYRRSLAVARIRRDGCKQIEQLQYAAPIGQRRRQREPFAGRVFGCFELTDFAQSLADPKEHPRLPPANSQDAAVAALCSRSAIPAALWLHGVDPVPGAPVCSG